MIDAVDQPAHAYATTIRIGEHSLIATHEKFETYEAEVTITEGEASLVPIHAEKKRGSLVVVGPVDGRVTVTSAEETDWEKRKKIPTEGKILFERVPPGRYEVLFERPEQPMVRKMVTIEAALEASVEFE